VVGIARLTRRAEGALSGSLDRLRTLACMRHGRWIRTVLLGSTIAALLFTASFAHAAPAIDQYSEGVPTASGQKSDRDVTDRDAAGVGGTARIPPATRAQLSRSKNGVAAATLAQITAPNRSNPVSSAEHGEDPAVGGDGLGLLLPLILAVTLLVAIVIFAARRTGTSRTE
jgi:hypothetical protein